MELQATLQGGRDVEGGDDDVVDGQHGGRQVELAPSMDVDAVPVPVTKVSDDLRPPKGHTGSGWSPVKSPGEILSSPMPRSRSPGIGASDGGVMAGSELNREKEQVDEEGEGPRGHHQ